MKFNILKYAGILFLSILVRAKFNIDLTNVEYVLSVVCIFLISFENGKVVKK